MAKIEFELPTDESSKSTEFKPFKLFLGFVPIPHCGRSKKTNPHMRAFWAATLAFMLAFIGWFAFAPLMVVVRKDIGLCDNNDDVQAALAEGDDEFKCVCGPTCKSKIADANIAAVSFDVFTRFILGAVIEKFGPRLTDCFLLSFGALMVLVSTSVTSHMGLIFVRFFVSSLGSTFVVNQFWNSIMFNPTCVGLANGTAGGWGNLGGGLTQVLMPLWYRFWHDGVGLPLAASWRLAMLFPATCYLVLVVWIFFFSQDTTQGRFDVTIMGKTKSAPLQDYARCLKDYRVFLMIWQYSACFGCELVMNNVLATHFADYFGVDIVAAGALALCFGGMNLFARSLGGLLSDWANKRWHMQGRLWAHFVSLFGQSVFLFLFGCVNSDMGWQIALPVLIIFSVFVNMAEGTSYAIVPYMMPSDLAVVSAMIGAGGTLGAVVATWGFYKYVEDTLLSFKLHAAYVLFWAMTCFLMRWDHLGSMFGQGTDTASNVDSKQHTSNTL